jgi:uncharacterized membrane protein HdeD (DUF308 family)
METTDVRQTIAGDAQALGRWIGLRGVIMLLFGILFLARPGAGVGILVAAFGVYCFLEAIVDFTAAITGVAMRSRGVLVLEGLLSVAAGVLAFAMPGNVAIVILYVVAIRALIVGALEVIGAIRLSNAIPSPWLLVLSGLASVLFGVLLARNPQAGLVSLAWLVGLYGVVLGGMQIAAAFGLQRAIKRSPPLRTTQAT